MRKEYNKRIKSEFEAKLKGLCPQFKRVKPEPSLGYTSFLYRFQASEDFFLFIELLPDRSQENFTVVIGWSTDGVLPEYKGFASPYDTPNESGHLARLPRFYVETDDWWVVEPRLRGKELLQRVQEGKYPDPCDYIPRIPGLMDDVFAKIKEYALPYFTRIAAERGVDMEFCTS